MASSKGFNVDLVGGILVLVLGILLLVGILDLETILGVAMIVLGIMAITRNV